MSARDVPGLKETIEGAKSHARSTDANAIVVKDAATGFYLVASESVGVEEGETWCASVTPEGVVRTERAPVERLLNGKPYRVPKEERDSWGVETDALASDGAELVATVGPVVHLFDLEGEITITADEAGRIREKFDGLV